jgi:hypothetical protein
MRHAMTTEIPPTGFMSLNDSQMESRIHESDTFSSVRTNFKGTWHHRNTAEGNLTYVLSI